MTALLTLTGISKRYGEIRILEDISIEIRHNEIVGLAGENGAGKSTALKLIAGVIAANSGSMTLGGMPYNPANYLAAVRCGVAMVFQEQALIGNLRVFENIFYGFENRYRRIGVLLDHSRMRADAIRSLASLGFGHIDADAITDELPFHERQIIEIARAFILAEISGISHPLILLDEPTAAIGESEVRILFEAIRRLRNRASFVIVTHKLTEYIELCDRLYVFKDGSLVGELAGSEMKEREIHQLMVGRIRDEKLYHENDQRTTFGPTRLKVDALRGKGLSETSFEIGSGEILGLGGLVGCGKEHVVRGIVGHAPFPISGEIHLNNFELPVRRRSQVAKKHGLGYVPKERKNEGIIGYMSVSKNISLPALEKVSAIRGIISPRRERKQALDMIARLMIRARGPDQYAIHLSGGNQQKLVVAKWLAKGISVLMLDNPTRGVDIGAKTEIYRIIRKLADDGVSILLVSDDLLELIGLSNRILVMREGEIVAKLSAPPEKKPTEHDIVRHMT